jgi:hypothetical protein
VGSHPPPVLAQANLRVSVFLQWVWTYITGRRGSCLIVTPYQPPRRRSPKPPPRTPNGAPPTRRLVNPMSTTLNDPVFWHRFQSPSPSRTTTFPSSRWAWPGSLSGSSGEPARGGPADVTAPPPASGPASSASPSPSGSSPASRWVSSGPTGAASPIRRRRHRPDPGDGRDVRVLPGERFISVLLYGSAASAHKHLLAAIRLATGAGSRLPSS